MSVNEPGGKPEDPLDRLVVGWHEAFDLLEGDATVDRAVEQAGDGVGSSRRGAP